MSDLTSEHVGAWDGYERGPERARQVSRPRPRAARPAPRSARPARRKPRLGRSQGLSAADVVSGQRIIVIAVDDLRALLQEVVAEEIAQAMEGQPQQGPVPLMTRSELAKYLGLSAATVDRMTNAGMPYELAGDRRRYDCADVRAWMRARRDSQ